MTKRALRCDSPYPVNLLSALYARYPFHFSVAALDGQTRNHLQVRVFPTCSKLEALSRQSFAVNFVGLRTKGRGARLSSTTAVVPFWLTHGGNGELLKRVSESVKCVMCMGHNKGWEEAASDLAGTTIKLNTGEAVLLEMLGETWEAVMMERENSWAVQDIIRQENSLSAI
eukprot:9439849-Pyramimonas_sp.AAC.1